MSIWSRLTGRQPSQSEPTAKPTLVGGRVTKPVMSLGGLTTDILRPLTRSEGLAEKLRLIRDINPDASLAVWNVLRMGISDWEMTIVKETDAQGQDVVDQELTTRFLDWAKNGVAKDYGKGLENFMIVAMLTIMTEGGIAAEVEVGENLQEIIDWHLVTPALVHARRAVKGEKVIGDPKPKVEGALIYYWMDQLGVKVDLSETQFRYIPLDPEIGDPYGRSPILPVLWSVDFQLQLLMDLQAVVHNQGYPRIDISVLEEAIIGAAPTNLQQFGKEGELTAFVESTLQGLAEKYRNLKPDDAFFHMDSIEVNTWSPGNSMDFGTIENILTTQIVSGLKQLPILLGRNEGTTETHGTVQYRIYVKGIESLRNKVAELTEFCANLTLRIWGVQGKAKLEFEPIRHTDRAKEALADKSEHETKAIAVKAGWIDNDEAANDLYGHDATGEKQPDQQTVVITPGGEPQGPPETPQPPEEPTPPEPEPAAPEGDNKPPEQKKHGPLQDRYRKVTPPHRPMHCDCGWKGQAKDLKELEHGNYVCPECQIDSHLWEGFLPDDKPLELASGHVHDRVLHMTTRQWYKNVPGSAHFKRELIERTDSIRDKLIILFEEQVDAYATRLDEVSEGRATEGSEEWIAQRVFTDDPAWAVRLQHTVEYDYRYIVGRAGDETMTMLKSKVSFDLLSPKAMAYLNAKEGSFVGMQRTTRDKVMNEVRKGFREGKHPYVVARDMRRDPALADLGRHRAEMIARTEMLEASNRGTLLGYEQSGIVDRIQWVATEDDRTCDICAGQDRDEVELGEDFGTGPCPPAHALCRCTTAVSSFKEFKPDEGIGVPGGNEGGPTLEEQGKGWEQNVMTPENAPQFTMDRNFKPPDQGYNPTYTALDENSQRYLCKWTDGAAGKSSDEYNAMQIDRWLGVNRVPDVTVVNSDVMKSRDLLYELKGKFDSELTRSDYPTFMKWADDAVKSGPWTSAEEDAWRTAESWRMSFFDQIIGNMDRQSGNFLISEAEQKYILIDNSYSLTKTIEESLRTYNPENYLQSMFNTYGATDPSGELKALVINLANKTDQEIQNLVDGMVEWTDKFRESYAARLRAFRDAASQAVSKLQ